MSSFYTIWCLVDSIWFDWIVPEQHMAYVTGRSCGLLEAVSFLFRYECSQIFVLCFDVANFWLFSDMNQLTFFTALIDRTVCVVISITHFPSKIQWYVSSSEQNDTRVRHVSPVLCQAVISSLSLDDQPFFSSLASISPDSASPGHILYYQ